MRSFVPFVSVGGASAAALLAACTTFGTATATSDAGDDAPRRPGEIAQDGGSKDSAPGADVVSSEGKPGSGCPPGKVRVFVTSGAFPTAKLNVDGMSPQEAADAICNDHATRAGMSNTVWTAWLSARFKPASDTMPLPLGAYTDVKCRMDIAVTFGKGDLLAPINTTETGERLVSSLHTVWTGTKADGGIGETCGNWTDGDSDPATTGDTEQKSSLWTDSPGVSCASSGRLYCVEGARRRP